ncbi:hypothetical protein A2U01_0082948 [Trifolium medium]|uniref:Uncharacterized protein n=1 Tax=Trifolium medium TaxID=97028 RepID=A0A392TKL8_9FABA|nr:hypothetical protein [Trifolium medium]
MRKKLKLKNAYKENYPLNGKIQGRSLLHAALEKYKEELYVILALALA